MRKLVYSMMVSLDGFIEGTDGSLDWVIVDEELHRYINEQQTAFDTELYGRRMYDVMAAYWPTGDTNPASADFEVDFALIWQRMNKIVFSRTLDQVVDNTRLVREVDPDEIRRLKEQPGKDISVGGANLASSLIQMGLVDEYWLYLNPVLLGGGKRMFPDLGTPLRLQLVETKIFGSGVQFLRYRQQSADTGVSEASDPASKVARDV